MPGSPFAQLPQPARPPGNLFDSACPHNPLYLLTCREVNAEQLCLPDQAATRQRRTVRTELGADDAAIQTEHRVDALFDIGVDARNVDFCIRTGDRVLRKLLRAACGLSIFASGNRIMAAILAANPHRIVQSSLGRVEVYQPIGTDVTPEGPHTHLLPKLLKSARTHSANVPVPKGFIPALGLHPPSSVTDAKGDDKPFEPTQLENFERLMGKWGLAEYCQEKARLRAAIAADMDPEFYPSPQSRIGRTALRVALRQLYRTCPDHSILVHWSERWGR